MSVNFSFVQLRWSDYTPEPKGKQLNMNGINHCMRPGREAAIDCTYATGPVPGSRGRRA